MTGRPVRSRRLLVASVAAASCLAAMSATAWASSGGPGVVSALGTTTTSAPGGAGTPGTGSSTASSPLCSAARLSEAKQVVGAALGAREAQLHRLVTRVQGAATLTSSDRSTLLGDLTQTELPGIEALASKVPGDTTCAELRQDAHSMVFDYRVYLVMTPQADLVVATDTATAIATTMSGLEPVIATRISAAAAKGKDVSGADAALSDYTAKVGAVQQLLAGQAATLLALTPAGYPGNAPALHQARANLQTARADLRAARSDLETIRHDLS